MGTGSLNKLNEPGKKQWLSYAHWVRDAAALMRTGAPGKIGLFESSVPEPTAMLANTIAGAFRAGPPAAYQSVFMRSHPDIVARLANRYGVARENVFCTTGATATISLVYRSLLESGDQVLIEKPGFDIFANCARDAGLESHFFDRAAPDFDVSVEKVIGALTPETRMVVLSDLHNPSGKSVSLPVLKHLAEELELRGVYLLIDEVYSDYSEVYSERIDPAQHRNVMRVSSLTKTFGLSSLRCGWLFAHTDILSHVRARFEFADFNVSKLAHAVAAQVLLEQEQYDGWRSDHMTAARPIAEAAMSQLQRDGLIEVSTPLEGCICFPKVVGVDDTMAFSKWLITHHGVVVVPGECFGSAGHIRIGYALNETTLDEAMKRLASGLAEYRAITEKQSQLA